MPLDSFVVHICSVGMKILYPAFAYVVTTELSMDAACCHELFRYHHPANIWVSSYVPFTGRNRVYPLRASVV